MESNPADAKKLSAGLFLRLAVMMALQWGVWVWFPFLGMFLLDGKEFTAGQLANIFIVAAIGIMLAPFIAGQCVGPCVILGDARSRSRLRAGARAPLR